MHYPKLIVYHTKLITKLTMTKILPYSDTHTSGCLNFIQDPTELIVQNRNISELIAQLIQLVIKFCTEAGYASVYLWRRFHKCHNISIMYTYKWILVLYAKHSEKLWNENLSWSHPRLRQCASFWSKNVLKQHTWARNLCKSQLACNASRRWAERSCKEVQLWTTIFCWLAMWLALFPGYSDCNRTASSTKIWNGRMN